MGVWGSGNFDGDGPRDYLGKWVGRWVGIVDEAMAGGVPEEARAFQFWPGLDLIDGCVMPTVELIAGAIEHLDCDVFPAPEKVAAWSERILATFDREIDGHDPDPGFQAERRGVLVAPLDRLLGLVLAAEADDPPDRAEP